MAAEHHLDMAQIKPGGGRIEKGDVLAYLEATTKASPPGAASPLTGPVLASPKARRLAAELGIDLSGIIGSGPDGAVLADDLPAALPIPGQVTMRPSMPALQQVPTLPLERLKMSFQ